MSEEKQSKIDTNRRDMPKQTPEMRRHNFNEVAFGYTEELAVAEASRCLQCKKPRCKTGCPVEIDIPDFISCIVKKDFRAGIRKLK
ncbi:MAG: dihydropyrimidine dehydrogenase, partial [Syntrophorhabdus sp.]